MITKNLYKSQELSKPSFFQRLLNKKPKENAIIEVHNLFSKSKYIKDITIDNIQEISESYKINLVEEFHTEMETFYTVYLKHCLSDDKLSDEEMSDLLYLKKLLNLNDKAIEKIHKEVAGLIYRENIEKVIADGRINSKEREFLEKLQCDLKLKTNIAKKIYNVTASKHLENYMHLAISDERLSPEEDEEINEISKNLGIETKRDAYTKSLLEKYRLFWLIENGNIPEINANIKIQKNEKCYFTCEVNWYELRRVTKRIRYAGPTMRIKIVKGVYWRMGDLAIQPVSEDILTPIDTGTIYLTNKRLIFMGSRKNSTIRLNKIIDFTAYKNGVEIQKETGKSPFLQMDESVDIFAMILGKAIEEF